MIISLETYIISVEKINRFRNMMSILLFQTSVIIDVYCIFSSNEKKYAFGELRCVDINGVESKGIKQDQDLYTNPVN